MALAQSASDVINPEKAERLYKLLGSYFLKAPNQSFTESSSIFRKSDTSPWQSETKMLTKAVINLGAKVGSPDELLYGYIDKILVLWASVNGNATSTDPDNYSVLFPLLFSLQGFLEALIDNSSKLSNSFIETGILNKLVSFVDHSFLLKIETAVSSIISRQNSTKSVSSRSSPLWLSSFFISFERNLHVNAMLLSWYLCSLMENISRDIFVKHRRRSLPEDNEQDVLDMLLDNAENDPNFENSIPKDEISPNSTPPPPLSDSTTKILNRIRTFSVAQIQSLDEGADYIELASPEKVNLAFSVKSSTLRSLGVSNYFNLIPASEVSEYLESSLHYERLLVDHPLYADIYKLGAILCYQLESVSSYLCSSLPDFVSNPLITPEKAWNLSETLTKGLKLLSQDYVVSLIYTLVNLLTPDSEASPLGSIRRIGTFSTVAQTENNSNHTALRNGTNGAMNGSVDHLQVLSFRNIITSIVAIGATYGDSQISTLSSTVLSQKISTGNTTVNCEVIHGLSLLAPHAKEKEFKAILRAFSNIESSAVRSNQQSIIDTVRKYVPIYPPPH